jgi:hypothetical protein
MSPPRPTVWVVKEQVVRGMTGPSAMDYTPAYKYGDVKFITDTDFPVHPASSVRQVWTRKVREFLRDIRHGDSIVLTGGPLAIFLVGYACANGNVKPTILVWRRELNEYVPLDVLGQLDLTLALTV